MAEIAEQLDRAERDSVAIDPPAASFEMTLADAIAAGSTKP